VILKDLRVFTISILSPSDSITYVFAPPIVRKSVRLKDLESFIIILLRGASNQAIITLGRGDISHFGTQFEEVVAVCK
jgi:hypothetical protein